jgi:hypothetical protein
MTKVGMSGKQRRFESHVLKSHKSEALQEQGGCCRYCLQPLTVKTATADHRLARAKGGANDRANIVAACEPCNKAKGSLNVLSFVSAIKRPTAGAPVAIWMAWSRRRMWLATYRACRNIRYAVGLDNDTPVGRRAA